MARSERQNIIKQIECARQSKVLCYLTSDRPNLNVQVQKDILPIFVNLLGVNTRYNSIDIFVFTQGGDTLAAFGLSRLLREHSTNVNALIPEKCHSAGTLFSLGANQIIMTSGATLSPIDPSIVRPLNPAVQTNPGQPAQLLPLSVESVAGFKALAKDDWGIKREDALISAFKVLTEKVHPLALGDVYRVRQQIEHLATELLLQHRSDTKQIRMIVDTLSKRLGSHDYLIYRSEAQKIVGSQIFRDEAIEQLIWNLYLDFSQEMKLGQLFDPSTLLKPHCDNPNTRTAQVSLTLAMIEGDSEGYKAVRDQIYTEETIIPPSGQPMKIMHENILNSGWQKY